MRTEHEGSSASTTAGLPVAPSLAPTLAADRIGQRDAAIDPRTAVLAAIAALVAVVSAVIAQGLVKLIALITNAAFYQQFSTASASPAGNRLGPLVVLVPVVGGLIVGVMARYGSAAIRGHGIPEAMERVLEHESRIPPRVMFLKPLSAALSIGTGGPFGAEGPIIATGGALGSVVGQLLKTTADERRILLAAGAAAGMSATFGAPVSALLLAIELLLFGLGPRSMIPVALASATAAGVRIVFIGGAPAFPMPAVAMPGTGALLAYVVLGGLVGIVSVYVTRAVHLVEDTFARLPIHWMWWPALGGVAVGVVGWIAPRTLGVGYENIEHIVSGDLAGRTLAFLCAMKFVSWAVSLGSGTSGGTLAPLFTIGGGLGAVLGAAAAHALPGVGIDPRVAGLVGMAALFAGASRAMLTSVVFAFETTRQPATLLPLLGACGAASLASCLLMKHSIMTVKIARRGVVVPTEFGADVLDHVRVAACATRDVVTLDASRSVAETRAGLDQDERSTIHAAFPVVDRSGLFLGVLTRHELMDTTTEPDRPIATLLGAEPRTVSDDATMREAVALLVLDGVVRLPVLAAGTRRLVGLLTRSDLVRLYRRGIDARTIRQRFLSLHAIRRVRLLPFLTDRADS